MTSAWWRGRRGRVGGVVSVCVYVCFIFLVFIQSFLKGYTTARPEKDPTRNNHKLFFCTFYLFLQSNKKET